MKVKKDDFIEIDFVARVKETNQIFDLTEEKVAKENNLYDEKVKYKPLVISVGNGFVLPGLDKELVGRETGKKYNIEIKYEDGFGKKDGKLIQLVNTNVFRKQNIRAVPGLQVNVDDMIGVIKSVSGGRTLIDFNHPLSGRDLVYEIKINKIIKDDKVKIKSILDLLLKRDIDFSYKEGNLVIKLDFPKELQKPLIDKIKELVSKVKKVQFKANSK